MMQTTLKNTLIQAEKDKVNSDIAKLFEGVSFVVDENFKQLDSQKLLIYRDGLLHTKTIFGQKAKPTHLGMPKVQAIAAQWKRDKIVVEQQAIKSIEDEKQSAIQAATDQYNNSLSVLKQSYTDAVTSAKEKLRELYEPIYLMRSNKDRILQFAQDNLIDLDAYTINYSGMSLNQLKKLTSLCTIALDEVLAGTKGKTSLLKWLYWPLWKKLSHNNSINMGIELSYLCLLLVAILLVRPYVMAVVSTVFFVQTSLAISVARRNFKLISAAYSISSEFENFDKYIETLIQDDPDVQVALIALTDFQEKSLEDTLFPIIADYDNRITAAKDNSIEASLDKEIARCTDASEVKLIYKSTESLIESKWAEYASKNAAFQKHFDAVVREINSRKQKCDESNNVARSSVYFDSNLKSKPDNMSKQEFFDYCDNLGGPGVPVNINYYMTTKIKTLAIMDKDNVIMGYNSVELPYKNILLTFHTLQERIEMITLSKLLLSNVLGGVRENFLEVYIIDPEGLGRDYPEFNTKDLLGTVTVITKKWEDFMEDIYTDAKSNLMTIGNKTFNDYNRDQSAENKTTLAYKLIIFVSTGDTDFFDNSVFLEFKNYSTDAGVWMWSIHADKDTFKKVSNNGSVEYPNDIDEVMNWPVVFERNTDEYTYNGQTINIYPEEKYLYPVPMDSSMYKSSSLELVKTMDQRSADVIFYEPEYRVKFIPDDKIWRTSSAKGVELHFGFFEGDRSNNNPEWFGSDGKKPVHCLMCGATGAGKSATINQVLANMLHQYSPEELIMIMIDFKNVEFGMYTDKSVPGRVPPSIIPHARIIAGTTDGEYALSVFDYALKEMRVRQGNLGVYQFQSIEDWNGTLSSRYPDKDHSEKEILSSMATTLGCGASDYKTCVQNLVTAFTKEETEDKVKAAGFNVKAARKLVLKHRMIVDGREIMPRMVILCDEFQVMFTEVEDKIVEEIKIRITAISKLARFAGCHLWFTSQSMKGTMSQDILDQFALRACLRCSKETSEDVLGNDAAYKYLRGRGFIYTNADKGLVTSNHKYTIPFAPNDYIKEYLAKLARKTRDDDWIDFKGDKRHGHVQYGALFYDEKFRHKLEEVKPWYNREEVRKLKTLMILGERTYFAEEKIPLHCIFQKADGEHLIICGSSAEDRFYLANTLITGCELSNIPFVISCPDPELDVLLNSEARVAEGVKGFIKPNTMDMIYKFFDSLIDIRTKKPEEANKPLFIFGLAWDKMIGLSIGDDYKIVDAFKLYLQKLGSLHVHIVITSRLSKSMKGFLPYISHRICAQCDETTSYDLIDSRVGTTLSNDPDIARTAAYYKDNKSSKFKIYLSDIDESKLQIQSIKIS